jgi:hypothetical protein
MLYFSNSIRTIINALIAVCGLVLVSLVLVATMKGNGLIADLIKHYLM